MAIKVRLKEGRWRSGDGDKEERKISVLLVFSSCSFINFIIFWWCKSLLEKIRSVFQALPAAGHLS